MLQKWFEVATTGNKKLLTALYNNYNINVNERDENGNTALLWSANNGHLDCVKFLVQQGAGIHDKNKTGNTAALLSAYSGYLDCLKYLIQQGADIYMTKMKMETQLCY